MEIAKKQSYAIKARSDLERRNNNSEDFIDISVLSLQAMLEESFKLGKRNKQLYAHEYLKNRFSLMILTHF